MAINFNINDKVRTTSCIETTLQYLPDTPTLRQTLQSLGYLGSGYLQVLAFGTYAQQSFIRLIPLTQQSQPNTKSAAFNRGNGLTLYFDSDDLINNCFVLAGGLLCNLYDSFLAKNTSAAPIHRGFAIYLTGIDSETRYPTIAAAHATSIVTATYSGLAENNIPVGASGYIQTVGCFQGINTLGGSNNSAMFLSTEPGLLQLVPAKFIVQVGVITDVSSQGSIRLGPIFGAGPLPIRGAFG